MIVEQVKQRTCQRLAPAVRCYLEKITHTTPKKEEKALADSMPLPGVKTRTVHEGMEGGEDQGSFLFQGDDNAPSNKKSRIKKKIKIVESLLEKYYHMSSNCRTKVQPVQSYLYNHLNVLRTMLKKCDEAHNKLVAKPKDAANEKIERQAKLAAANYNENSLLSNMKLPSENQVLEDAKFNKLKSRNSKSFDVDKFIAENVPAADKGTNYAQKQLSPWKKKNMHTGTQNQNEVDVSKWDGTEKYKRLVETANDLKRKRQTEERLGELFGRNKKRSIRNDKYNNIHSKNKEIQDLRNVNFEAPMVLSLDN